MVEIELLCLRGLVAGEALVRLPPMAREADRVAVAAGVLLSVVVRA